MKPFRVTASLSDDQHTEFLRLQLYYERINLKRLSISEVLQKALEDAVVQHLSKGHF